VKEDRMSSSKERNWFARYGKYLIASISILGIFTLMTFLPKFLIASKTSFDPLPTWEVENPVSTVFVMDAVPPTAGSLAAGDSTIPNEYLTDPAIDTLLLMMETKDVFLHQTISQPSGIVGSDNIVIIKGNFQWTNRNTPSTDRIKGLIWQILNHPDGFTGEILICDNTQDFGTGINHYDNNSEDPEQSIIDVINTFVAKGYPVYYRDWRNVWAVVAQEYSAGDYNDGFVYEFSSKISYPKFTSPSGNYYISLRYGIWNSSSLSYDPDRLCIIDFPVLKAHSMAGATIAVKNWIGVLTTAHSSARYGGFNSMHYTYFFGSYALVAKVMGATYPRLTILDAAWTSASGPNNLSDTVHTKMLLSSTDPSAVSWYGAKFILTPVAVNPYHTDPDRPGSNYRNNLEAWTNCLRDSGFACTKDSSEISVYDRDVLNPTGMKGSDETQNLQNFQLYQNYPNPFNSQTVISFELPHTAETELNIYDSNGRLIKSLIDNEIRETGLHHVNWDGTNELGKVVVSGVYFYNLEAGNFSKAKAMILKK
jgi:hypothetical protein